MIRSGKDTKAWARTRSPWSARTNMTMADVTGADFRGVDLRYVRGLTLRQLGTAHTDAGTRLSIRLRLVRPRTSRMPTA